MQPDKIVRMANQIASACAGVRGDPAGAVAEHVNRFWEPRMRLQLFAAAQAGADLHPLLAEALPSIRRPKPL